MPQADQAIRSGTIGYHLRTGKHDVTTYDWEQYIAFAKWTSGGGWFFLITDPFAQRFQEPLDDHQLKSH